MDIYQALYEYPISTHHDREQTTHEEIMALRFQAATQVLPAALRDAESFALKLLMRGFPPEAQRVYELIADTCDHFEKAGNSCKIFQGINRANFQGINRAHIDEWPSQIWDIQISAFIHLGSLSCSNSKAMEKYESAAYMFVKRMKDDSHIHPFLPKLRTELPSIIEGLVTTYQKMANGFLSSTQPPLRPGGVGGLRCPTPIHRAITGGYTEILPYLLALESIPVDSKNDSGDTALHLAVKYKLPEILEILLKKGANWRLWNDSKESPWDLALRSEIKVVRPFMDYIDKNDTLCKAVTQWSKILVADRENTSSNCPRGAQRRGY